MNTTQEIRHDRCPGLGSNKKVRSEDIKKKLRRVEDNLQHTSLKRVQVPSIRMKESSRWVSVYLGGKRNMLLFGFLPP